MSCFSDMCGLFAFVWKLNHTWFCMQTVILRPVLQNFDKNWVWRLGELPGWGTNRPTGTGVLAQPLRIPPDFATMCISPLATHLCFYNTMAIINRAVSWVLWIILTNYQTWRGGIRTPEFVANLGKSANGLRVTWDLRVVCEVSRVLWIGVL